MLKLISSKFYLCSDSYSILYVPYSISCWLGNTLKALIWLKCCMNEAHREWESCAVFSLLCQFPDSHVLSNHGPERPKQSQVLPYRGGLNQTPYSMRSVCFTLTCSTVQTHLYVNMPGKAPSNQSATSQVHSPCSHCVGGSHSAPRQCSLIT